MDKQEKYRQIRRAQAVAVFLQPRSDDLILDVGCGTGFMMNFFANCVGFVVGLDNSLKALKAARSNVTSSNTNFILGDATRLPLKSSIFDKVTILEVLEHLSHPKLCITEVDRCAKRDAVVVISVPYKEEIRMIFTPDGNLAPLWGHLHSFSEEDVFSLLPKHYKLLGKRHLPNMFFRFAVFQFLPLSIWLFLNDFIGIIRKGYWVILKFKKN